MYSCKYIAKKPNLDEFLRKLFENIALEIVGNNIKNVWQLTGFCFLILFILIVIYLFTFFVCTEAVTSFVIYLFIYLLFYIFIYFLLCAVYQCRYFVVNNKKLLSSIHNCHYYNVVIIKICYWKDNFRFSLISYFGSFECEKALI